MAQKITRSNVDHYLSVLNDKLIKMKAPYSYDVVGVNGGYALEKYNAEGDLVDTCISGKLREVYEIVRFTANAFGDNVPTREKMYWNDPDGGICSQYVNVISHDGETSTVETVGIQFEVMSNELIVAV